MDEGLSSLLQWDADGAIPDAMLARVIAHPHFAQAARRLAANMQGAVTHDTALDGIFKDAGRYVAAMMAVHLHVTGGCTLPHLKELGAATGYLSPGRARAMLLYLRYLGYVESDPARERPQPARYVPTARFREAWSHHLRVAIEAAECIEPGVSLVLEHFHETEVFDALARAQGEGYLATAQAHPEEDAFTRVFMHRHAGNQIMWTLIGAGEDGAFPPGRTAPISIAGMARQFRVSRPHVRRLFDEAVREQLIVCEENGAVVFQECARKLLEFHYATQLARLLVSSAKTVSAVNLRRAPKKEMATAAR